MNILLFLATAFAETTPVGQVTTALTYNRIALSVKGQYGSHIPMWEKEDSTLLNNTGIDLMGEFSATPAFTRGGVRAVVLPIAVLKLQGYANAGYYFGNWQTIVGYDSLDANYGENSTIKEYVTDNPERQNAGFGWSAGGSATLQAKVGNVVFSNTTGFSSWHINAPEGETGPGFFEREQEVMMEFGQDSLLDNNTLLLYQIDQKTDQFLRVGNLTTYRHSVNADDTMFRSGLLFVAQRSPSRSHIVIAQSYLNDRAFTSPSDLYIAYAYKYTM